jgi:uncharacterized protein YlzI (FlbEa/FlbD family)
MIELHRLHGEPFWVNADLVAYVDSGHDTVLTMADGRTLLVSERAADVAGAILRWRASVLAEAGRLRDAVDDAPVGVPRRPHLGVVPTPD